MLDTNSNTLLTQGSECRRYTRRSEDEPETKTFWKDVPTDIQKYGQGYSEKRKFE
jgi:hypothetical protein